MVSRVYLDTCVWLRPYDDQRQTRIRRETRAVLRIIEAAERGDVALASSSLLREEMEGMVSRRKQEGAELLAVCRLEVVSSPDALRLTRELASSLNLTPEDALHLSLAAGAVEAFLTCDDELLKRGKMIEETLSRNGYRLRVENPAEFVRRWPKPRR